ncbi:MAG: hypothetical protein HRT77_13515 [Halioglobus sp.]|nr:hypothetical protein [Halioglobus sp.]
MSSQTLCNLSVIDGVTDSLVLRPLVTTDKDEIMRIAGAIGTATFAVSMPEYCGVIGVKPATRARREQEAAQEPVFDMAILDRALAACRKIPLERFTEEALQRTDVEVLSVPLAQATIIDIRHPDESDGAPLHTHIPALHIPFYELHGRACELAPASTYMLYCGRGAMSRLHAGHLKEARGLDVRVYAP